jgi:HD superfamily phosphohydrolase
LSAHSPYHDVATPPFAHAMEEVLNDLYKFNHEEKLRNLIIGKHDDIGGQRVQVYLGRTIKLHEICQSAKGRELKLDVMRIADLAAGVKNDKLGDVICSKDIDLDNIDNVVRAASAMGVTTFNMNIAEIISKSFVFDGDILCLDKGVKPQLIDWQKVRSILYGMIFSSITDFSLQTMLKDSVRILADAEDKFKLRKEDWLLTDEQFIYERLMKYPPTLEIVKAMKLGRTYTCLLLSQQAVGF